MQNSNYIDEDEIDLKELFGKIWKFKFKIAAITFVITSLTILYTISIPNSYKSTIVLAPQEKAQGLNLGGLSALAGLSGVDLGGGNMDAYNSILVIIHDNTFQKRVIKKYDLIQKLENENMEKNFVFALGIKSIYQFLHSKSKDDEEEEKSEEEMMYGTIKKIKEITSVSSDKESGAITVSIELPDRFLAKELLSIYLEETALHLRTIEMKDIDKQLLYYNNELAGISDIELRMQISQLIATLIQKKVLSYASEYYNVKLMTQPAVAYVKDKSKPKRALMVIVSFILSIIVSIALMLLLEFLKEEKEID